MGDLLPYPSSCTETNLDPGRDARRDERATAEPCAGGRMPRHGLSRLLSELCISISPAAPPPLRWKMLPPLQPTGPSVSLSSHSSGATCPFHHQLAGTSWWSRAGRGGEGPFARSQSPSVAYLPGACSVSASCFSSPPPRSPQCTRRSKLWFTPN